MTRYFSNISIADIFLHPEYRKTRYLLSGFVLTVITVSMILNNIHYLGSSGHECLEWITYFSLMFGIISCNVGLFVPRFLLKNRIVAYFVAVLIMVIAGLIFLGLMQVCVFTNKDILAELSPTSFYLNAISSLVSMSLLVTGSSAILLLRYWIRNCRLISDLEAATLHSELEMLKSQINPHFLFNMLNNANVMIWKNKEEAREMLYKLESMLRYQLKDAAKDKILLKFEILFLHDFLNLEKIRRDNFDFTITKEGIIEDIWIPSLLFIPFVENAVKHNPDNNYRSYVFICFKMVGKILEFSCKNSKPSSSPVSKKAGGLGLLNIQRRLSLMYPGKHFIKIEDESTCYNVTLKIEMV